MRNPTDTRNVSPRPGSALWIYIGAVTIAGAAVLVAAALYLHHLTWFVHRPVFWVVGAMILAGEIWRIITPGRSGPDSPAVSRTISASAMLCWGLPVAMLLRAIVIVVVGLAQRNSPQRVAFNAAQLSLSLGAAGAVLWVTGYDPTLKHPWVPDGGHLVALLLAGVAYFVVNFSLVNLVVASISRTPLKAVIRANLAYQGVSHLVLFGTAPLVAIVMQTMSPIMVALFALPLAALYLSAAMSVQREHQANHDELTGLLNRKLLARRSGEALARAANSGSKAGFLLIDLDRATGLKQVNDTLGHAVGDRLLQVVAHRLAHSVRPGDVVARLGGDEFAVLLPSVREAASAREVASRLRAALAEPVRLEVMTFHVEASVGIAIFPDDADNFDQLMQRADVAMYLAKERRSGIERYQADADRNSAERLALLGDLRGAVHDRQIELYYQPIVLLAGERVIGMEALARWPHPRHGMLDAAEFIGLAEQSHLTSELTEHVLDKALSQAARWWRDGLRVPVSVNLPARDLVSSRLVELVVQLLQRHGLEPQALRLDVSEQVLAARPLHVPEAVKALTSLGVGVSLDDFGAGYSSLAQLTRIGVSEVKLDPALVTGMPDNPERRMTVESLVRLAQSLGIRAVGEGVETDAEAAVLRLVGCDAAQGWLFGRPLDAREATEWLARHVQAGSPGARCCDQPSRPAVASGFAPATVGGS
jgi:diguanylate cyclase (GGDEF)-like protein